MAKIYGINNDIVGRLGNEVFERQGDANIVRGYNPHHSGTPSQEQLIQKARLDCMGNWERRLPLQAVEAFNGNKSQKWSAFVRKNMPLVHTRVLDDGTASAYLDVEAVRNVPSVLNLGGKQIEEIVTARRLLIYWWQQANEWRFAAYHVHAGVECGRRNIIMGIPLDGDSNKVQFGFMDVRTILQGEAGVINNPFQGVDPHRFLWILGVCPFHVDSWDNFVRANNYVFRPNYQWGDRDRLLSNVVWGTWSFVSGEILSEPPRSMDNNKEI